MSAMAQSSALLCVGQFVSVHGVQGCLRLRSFTADPAAIFSYGPLLDRSGSRCFHLMEKRPHENAKQPLLVQVQGILDRDAAKSLTGVRLYIPRERLPTLADEDEIYHADLIGCQAELDDGTVVGRVKAVHDFGAGDILEIDGAKPPGLMLAFTKANVPQIDLARSRLVVVLPLESAAKEQEAP